MKRLRQDVARSSTSGKTIGYPTLKPHELRHGGAMEILEQLRDLEAVRATLGHVRPETTQVYAHIRPAQLRTAVQLYEAKALDVLGREAARTRTVASCLSPAAFSPDTSRRYRAPRVGPRAS